ncbi:MAG: hypothetical protein Ta2E_09050 [Mycoplasmoidaceae bacterium]|nr:MAG: hypothetical protein Ta2E_09050 [Mycoplasmoidaceae bacterium]
MLEDAQKREENNYLFQVKTQLNEQLRILCESRRKANVDKERREELMSSSTNVESERWLLNDLCTNRFKEEGAYLKGLSRDRERINLDESKSRTETEMDRFNRSAIRSNKRINGIVGELQATIQNFITNIEQIYIASEILNVINELVESMIEFNERLKTISAQSINNEFNMKETSFEDYMQIQWHEIDLEKELLRSRKKWSKQKSQLISSTAIWKRILSEKIATMWKISTLTNRETLTSLRRW